MKIIVTGGCGFIGSHVVKKLLENNDVLVVDNLSVGKEDSIDCQLAKVDITDADMIKKVFSDFKPEVIIHMAAQIQVRKSLEDPIFDAQQNIIGTISVLEAARKCGSVKKFIYTATGGARYGDPEKLPVKEDDPVRPISPYGISKHSAEHYVEAYGKLYGFDYLILCFGNVYGPGGNLEGNAVITAFVRKLLKSEAPEIFGDGNQTRDFLYVEDVAEIISSNLARSTKHKIFNLGSGTQVSVNEVFEEIETSLKTGLEPVHTKAIEGEIREIELNISLAVNELGFKPTSFSEGIKKTIDWYKK